VEVKVLEVRQVLAVRQVGYFVLVAVLAMVFLVPLQ
jgi:hypothetical protein